MKGDKAMRALSLRLPEELADDAELVARVQGVSLSELIRAAIVAHVELCRAAPKFREHLRQRIAADERLLQRLEGGV